MKKKDVYVAALDAARNRDLDDLQVLIYAFFSRSEPHIHDIVNQTLFTVYEKLSTGEPSILLAPKLRGIARNKRLQILTHEAANRDIPSGSDEPGILEVGDFANDPAAILVRRQRILELLAVHNQIGVKNPRQFEIIAAEIYGADAREHLKDTFGESPDAATIRQSRKRAHDHAKKIMPNLGKGDQP
jgi:hypothetical protein